MKGCRSIKDVRKDGPHLVAELRDMLEIDGYELLDVEIWDPKTVFPACAGVILFGLTTWI